MSNKKTGIVRNAFYRRSSVDNTIGNAFYRKGSADNTGDSMWGRVQGPDINRFEYRENEKGEVEMIEVGYPERIVHSKS